MIIVSAGPSGSTVTDNSPLSLLKDLLFFDHADKLPVVPGSGKHV